MEIDVANTARSSFALKEGIGFSAPINESIEPPFVQVPSSIYSTDPSSILNYLLDSPIITSFSTIDVSISCCKENTAPELINTTVLIAGDYLIIDDSFKWVFYL